ncbi:hypothetical protein [Rhizosaccharibacter radicis]|uniref:DUF2188 domain-containing protein n=1 Tax=Rhizosaccharibacter radicis TaxID=2782605 RepID=A0ABT1VYW1_9PROT|nr:hypothetical protein [Acetobacteraceae bacterium KSS12]
MSFTEVIELPNGHFAVKITGGDVLHTPREFPTREEAEEWLIRNAGSGGGSGIMRPGDGQGLT